MEETEQVLFDGRIYRGDTFKFDFSATLEGSTNLHIFEAGDILKAGIKTDIRNNEYIIFKEITIQEPTTEVTFEFSHEEMLNAPIKDNAILEVELTNTAGIVSTIYQEKIEIVGDVINE